MSTELSNEFSNEVMITGLLMLVKTSIKITETVSDDFIRKNIYDIISLLTKESMHITKNQEYFEELFFFFFEQNKKDFYRMSDHTINIYNDIKNNLLNYDIDKLNTITSEINYKTNKGYSLLSIACFTNNFIIIEKLLNLGADINLICNNMTALDIALNNNDKSLVHYLINKGANTFVKINNDNKKILESKKAEIEKKKDKICSCCNTWKSYNTTTNNTTTTKHINNNIMSTTNNNILAKIKNEFIKLSDEEFNSIIPEINYKCKEGWTFLYFAAQHKNLKLIEKLLDNGANIELECQGYSPLFVSVLNNNENVVKLLVSKGANVNFITKTKHKTFSNKSILHLAILQGQINICKILLDNGADFRVIVNGETYLKIAYNLGMKQLIIYIIDKFHKMEMIELVSILINENLDTVKDTIVKCNKKIFTYDNIYKKIIENITKDQLILMLKKDSILTKIIKDTYLELLEVETLKQKEVDRLKQIEIDKHMQILSEKRKEVDRLKQLEADRLKQIELENQKEADRLKQLEADRLKQLEADRLKQLEADRLKQFEVEKQKEADRLKQLELDRLKQIELEKQKEVDRLKQVEIETLIEIDRLKQIEDVKRKEAEWLKQKEINRQEKIKNEKIKLLEAQWLKQKEAERLKQVDSFENNLAEYIALYPNYDENIIISESKKLDKTYKINILKDINKNSSHINQYNNLLKIILI